MQSSNISADVSSPGARFSFNKYRGSIAWTEGFEKNLHVLGKDQYPDRAMGVFTSGGDAQGRFIFIIVNPFSILLSYCMHYISLY